MEIKFIPLHEHQVEPVPAIRKLPEWYKALATFTHGKKEILYTDGTANETVKRCNPVGDALGAGYYILLENDVYVTKASDSESGAPELRWLQGGDGFISQHSKQQISKDLAPLGFNTQPYKFNNFWAIKTPKGYSTLFVHPLNRPELPFYTLQGVVDTDTYDECVEFPFFIKDDFEGLIRAGTPIVQVIPIKRDKWSSFIASPDPIRKEQLRISRNRSRIRWYKNNFWQKKEYK